MEFSLGYDLENAKVELFGRHFYQTGVSANSPYTRMGFEEESSYWYEKSIEEGGGYYDMIILDKTYKMFFPTFQEILGND